LESPVDDQTFQTYLDFFVYDENVPFDVITIDSDESEGVSKEHLSFQSTPGVRVFAYYYRPSTGTSRERPFVLLLHGGAPTGKDGRGTEFLSAGLVRGGFNVLAIDMQYFGERKTDLITSFTEQEKHDRLYNQTSTYLAWVGQTVKDLGRSFDLLVERMDADPGHIGLAGFSRGAQLALIAGGADPRFAAVAAIYAGHFDALENGHLAPACPANYIGRISPRPLYMINGTHDADMVRETSVLPLQRLAGEPNTFVWAETGHRFPGPEYRAQLVDWLRATVTGDRETGNR
jgi:dienelactone hydrolase